jgi:hypothetical protein
MKFLQKIEDFLRNQRDKSEIVEDKNFGLGWYWWDGRSLTSCQKPEDVSFTSKGSLVRYKPGQFYVEGLYCFTGWNRECIKVELFIKDLKEIAQMERLDILGIVVESDDWRHVEAKVWFRESDFQEGDGLPHDILDYLISDIKVRLKKKADAYIRSYNILSSRKTTQKMKYRTSPLYQSHTPHQWNLHHTQRDAKKGVFSLLIKVNI